MKTVLRLSLGLLLAASLVGCHTCGQRSCVHKLFDNGCGCGCYDTQCGDACGCDEGVAVGTKRFRTRRHVPVEASMHGYDSSVVYTGDDWQGIPQPAMSQMPMTGAPSGGNCGCSGGMPSMAPMSSGGCAGCGAPASIPSQGGGCASCAGGNIEPQPSSGGCASCGGAPPTSFTPTPASNGGCASCGAGATNDSFFNPHHQAPAPAPPAEGIPGQNTEASPGDKAANQGETIQKIHWVPRQL